MNQCLNCGVNTRNPSYCSRSCSASATNKTSQKRKPEGVCKECGAAIQFSRSYCSECWKQRRKQSDDWTIQDLIDRGFSRFDIHIKIRKNARLKFKPKECFNCHHPKAQVCHIIPIKKFPNDTKLSQINDSDNLIGLCPNCHWGFDHGLIEIAGIPKKSISKPRHMYRNILLSYSHCLTIGELRKCVIDNGLPRSYAAALLHMASRQIYLETYPEVCVNCKFDLHIQVCHIASISSFNDDALISDINSIDNLIGLCPNCHAEHDLKQNAYN